MRPVENGLASEPGATVAFESEKLHIMFNKPNGPLKDGDRVPATLVFRNAGAVDVEFAVQRKSAEAPPMDHSGHNSNP